MQKLKRAAWLNPRPRQRQTERQRLTSSKQWLSDRHQPSRRTVGEAGSSLRNRRVCAMVINKRYRKFLTQGQKIVSLNLQSHSFPTRLYTKFFSFDFLLYSIWFRINQQQDRYEIWKHYQRTCMWSLPWAAKQINACACNRTLFTSKSRMANRLRKCSRKSSGVTTEMSHFRALSTNSSHCCN